LGTPDPGDQRAAGVVPGLQAVRVQMPEETMSDKPAKRIRKPRYSAQEIERALMYIALYDSQAKAHQALEEHGHKPPCRQTLSDWTRSHAGRLAELERDIVPKRRELMARIHERDALQQAEIVQKLNQRLLDNVDRVPVRDLAGAINRIDTSRAINVDKAALLRGMPTTITQHTSAEDILKRLAAQGLAVIEGTAEEIHDDRPALPAA
jgi:hypothetical protein